MTALSVLDLVPVRSDQTTGDAIAASRDLVRVADDLGYRRFWVAEHHNMPAVAATNPPVLIAMLASATERIRVGSGGVMLPNHAPLVVAEQFALLEAAFPGRIDLGIGRAPGTDPLTRYVLRGGSAESADEAVTKFPDYVEDIRTLMTTEGVELQVGPRRQPLRATPAARTLADMWLLGSSDYSARLAAEKGLPYVFAHHFSGEGTGVALDLYRSSYRPSPEYPEPRTFLTVNAVVAETEEEARRRALPNVQQMIALRTGAPLHAQRLVEEAEAVELTPDQRALAEAMARRWIVGAPEQARARIEELAQEFGVDEVMVHPVAGAAAGTDVRTSPAREETLRLLVG
ncbi:LLM class flavin-dependent oxidoreductase [Nocardioides sp. zg-1228]|uniref:LLM class flavin-dependent oxidoreductase n=1 Tax=Nocardioides sp. zg-1228 TaxID=2763008 RepID=UPI0016430CCF|nr:LLM class flavin-dependent oxidoreductase [Nocardioides sp. zg-1228]MBC2932418.1 LLM class flavin-dependent oxidoreductase [Nocardioides sp. zg-1228]QSF57930.1 LLM class flavin-dependent oxidoreductase [Nocardioides sp. zg-1228]